MESSKRSKQHRESSSSKRDKKASSSNRDSHSGGKKQPAPRFGNLIPRNDELKHLATNILGDYHSTVETLTQDHNRLMGVDRTLPITPLPSSLSSSSSNPFENAFGSHVNRQTKAPPTSLTINSHFSNEEPLPHPLSQADGTGSRHSKKRKKNQVYKKEPEPTSSATEHAQLESLPKSATKVEEKKFKKLKKDKYESFDYAPSDPVAFSSHHGPSSSVVSSSAHVSAGSLEVPPPPLRKPNKLFIDTSSLDASDLQSIKDLIHLPPFITPIHTPCKKLDNAFHFPSSQPSTASVPNNTSNSSTLATTTVIMDSQNAPNTLHGNPITRTSSHQSGPGSTVPDILGDISSSEDNSSSSSEDEDDDDESEGERETTAPGVFSENTSSVLDQIRRELNPSLSAITPLKSSPPTLHRSFLPPTCTTDESANLSPAKFPHPLAPPLMAPSTTNDNPSSDSDSCSDSDSDSDSESESESQPLQFETHKSVLSSEGNTQPFDPAQHSSFDHTHTQRQESKPFAYEPESATPTPISTRHALGNFSQSHTGHAHQQSHGERVSSQNPKKRRHSENTRKRRQNTSHQERDEKKLHLSEVREFSNSRGSDDSIVYSHGKPHPPGGRGKDVSELVVQISLAKVEVPQKTKPQATVGPYHISSDSKRTGSVSDSSHSYRDSYHHSDHRAWPNDYNRSHREGGGERHWNETPPPGNRPSDEYWYHEPNSTSERSRHVNPQFYYDRAKSLKREADSLPPNDAVRKALKYMEAVTYFMRHGYSQETDLSGSGPSSRGGAYKIYSDIINMVKYCSKMGSECKPLLILCLRCHSVLLWRMFTLKQYNVHQLYKELQDVFNTSSKHHQKSPVPSGNFSPLPSPTSVGSTASSCSVPSASEQSLTVNKSSCSKVMEYLTLTNHVHQSVELWRQSDSMSSQHKDFFSNINRKIGDITQFSSLTVFTEWMESGLQHISRNV